MASGGSIRRQHAVEDAKKVVAAVQGFLLQDDICLHAVEANIIQQDTRRVCILAIVTNSLTDGKEAALFVLKPVRTTFIVDTIMPILPSIMVAPETNDRIKRDLGAEMLFRVKLQTAREPGILVEITNHQKLKGFVAEVQRAVNVASQEHVMENRNTHLWIKGYQGDGESPSLTAATGTYGSNPNLTATATGATTTSSSNSAVESYFKSIDARHIDGPDVLINTYMARSAFEYNPQMLTKIKEEWIEKELKNRAAEFTQPKTVSVFCGTWNVNGQVPKEDLSPWFTCESLPDIIAIGFQELDLSAEAFVFNDSGREEKWTKVIEGSIKGIEQYTKLKSRQLVGMLLIVYVKTPHIPFIANIQSEVTGTGIMSVMGNKGGVAIRFRIYDSDLCFVNSHLAADSGRVDRRNQDYLDICRRTLFTGARNVQFTIFDADILFWIGDLNYRIPLPDGDVKQAIKNREFANLLVNDELNIERAALRVFVGFEEGPIDFVPTYKYDVGTDNYDTSEKQRTPAWCDRILWKGKNVTQLFYRSHQQMRGSDHKPVAALFDIKVQIVLNEKLQEVRQRIVRDLDKMENECMPDATISTNHIDFGEVHYMQPVTQTLVISNIGQVICQYRFIPKLDEKKFCKPWMWIEPPMGMIVPGNKAQIRFTVLVDNATVAAMNAGDDKVEDILILHLENGKDYFVSVTGNYLKTCFGMPLDDLSKKHGAIREPPPADHLIDLTDALKVAEPVPKEGRAHVPHEIWNLVDFVYQRGMDEENLFMTSGNTEEMVQVRDDLDVGRDLNARYSVHSVAETLIRLLEALPEPVIPFSHYQRCLDCCNSYVLCKQLITQLPPAHSETFVYLISFLRECLAHKERNLLSPEKIALLFGSVLMRSHKKEVAKYAEAVVTKKKATFIFNFLVDDDETAQRSPLPLTATPSAAPLIQF